MPPKLVSESRIPSHLLEASMEQMLQRLVQGGTQTLQEGGPKYVEYKTEQRKPNKIYNSVE